MCIRTTDEILEALKEEAYNISDPFCYSCYKVVTEDYCPGCGTDDFMRHVEGVGVEYGIEWVMEHYVETEGKAIDPEEIYSEMLDECYPEVDVFGSKYSPAYVWKELDPIAFEMGRQEYIDSEVDEGMLIEVNGSYYRPF